MSDPNPRPLRTVRDLRDNTWMVREGLAEIERDQVLKKAGPSRRYELSKVPYLGTDGTATALDIVPHPRKIYEDDSDFIKASKRGGNKHLIWWHPDFPLEAVPEKCSRLLRPKPADWSVHPDSLLPNPHEDFAKTRKLPPINYAPTQRNQAPTDHEPTPREARLPGRTARLDSTNMPPAIGAPQHYSWEHSPKMGKHNMYKIMTNGYLPDHLHEQRKLNYFDSLMERPQNEQEKLQDQIFHEQRDHNRQLRETAMRFDRMTRGKPSWTEREHMNTRTYLFPGGWGRGMRAPPGKDRRMIRATEGLAGH